MLAPRRRLLALLALAGCFTDNGAATSPASTGASTTTVDPASTSGDDGATAQPTSTAPDDSTSTAETTTTTTADTTTGPPLDLECEVAPCFNVINRCADPLWIRAANQGGDLAPADVQLAPGEAQQYAVPPKWEAGRINAYWLEPKGNPEAHDKVEVTVKDGKMNYNITYVDYVALPVEMIAVGPECPPTDAFDPRVGCDVARDQLLAGCPENLRSGDRCLSAGLFCADSNNDADPYCHALDDAIAACAADNPDTCGVAMQLGDTTWHAYACAGYFDGQPGNCMPASTDCHFEGNKWCAALNRGMLADPESSETSAYYQKEPYNTYAKWVHDTCPGIYAFAYDDYPSSAGESGFRSCKADRLDVTFCPAG